MMNISITKNICRIVLSGMLILGTGCAGFLDEEDPSNLAPDNFYTLSSHAEAAIAAVYDNTRFYGNGAGIFSSNWQLLEAPTGTSITETAQNSDLNNLYSLAWDSNTGHVKNWWRALYRVIGQANLVLERVPGISGMDEKQKKKILGEASFFRAWAYFYAVRLWGDVPLVLIPETEITSENFYPSKATQQAVYDQIIKDLAVAEVAGLPWLDKSGRVSHAAVRALLSKVYLTMAGQPLNKGTEYYRLAADKAKMIIDSAGAGIGLFKTYKEVHDEALNNTVEHIFSLQYNSSVEGNPMGNMFPNFKPVSYRGPSGTGSTVPTRSFYNSYEAGDKRTVDKEGYFYTSYYMNGSKAPFDLGAPYIFKHFNMKANGTSGVEGSRQDNLNVPMIRYAEVLLIYAEAQNEVSGPDQIAYDGLKAIRDRAGLVTQPLGAYDKSSFREAVWKERWHEFCYEGITWFDMVRLRKVFNETTRGFDEFIGHMNLNSNQELREKHLLFPIPSQELINNPKLAPQNKDYN